MTKRQRLIRVRQIAVGVSFLILIGLLYLITPPKNFPVKQLVEIKEGACLQEISQQIFNDHLVRSRLLFSLSVRLLAPKVGVKAGEYYFEAPLNGLTVAFRLASGLYTKESVKVIVPPGLHSEQMVKLLSRNLPQLVQGDLRLLVNQNLGKLLPGTYFFPKTATDAQVIALMVANFNHQINPVYIAIANTPHSFDDVLVMASVIEKEESDSADRRLIADILWRRLAEGMLLQVDVATSTYKIKGLPEAPISNPSVEAIKDALNPTSSDDLYYLADRQGVTHYARTYEEHKQNIIKYLKS